MNVAFGDWRPRVERPDLHVRLRLIWIVFLAATLLYAGNAWAAQVAPASTGSTVAASLEPASNGAPVVVWNRTIAELHAPFRGNTAAERARGADARLAQVIDTLVASDITTEWTQSGGDEGMVIRANALPLFAIFPGDTPGATQAAAESEGRLAAQRLKQTIAERITANRPAIIFRGIALSVVATLVLAALWWGLGRAVYVVQQKLHQFTESRLKLDIGNFDLRPVVWGMLRWLVGLAKIAVILFLVYFWLSFVLRMFLYSKPWGEKLRQSLVDVVEVMAGGLIHEIPNLIILVVIYLIARGTVRLLKPWFDSVRRGSIQVRWLDSSTAEITRRLISFGIWLFALIVAYPYIPGASTDAFKGVSVFLGLMLSLGSAGIVNQAMSGLLILYSRAIRVGDFVKVGEHEGVVREMGTVSLKLLTRTKLEISVPNAFLSTVPVCNFTRQSRENGFLLTTSVTIGYDTPWRQVVAMLELAAFRTSGFQTNPKPFVLQTSLSDFYVEYQLNVALLNPTEQPRALSELHQNIQDTFNEFGVQIMSPHFRDQPQEKVWSPRTNWFDSPAQKLEESQSSTS